MDTAVLGEGDEKEKKQKYPISMAAWRKHWAAFIRSTAVILVPNFAKIKPMN